MKKTTAYIRTNCIVLPLLLLTSPLFAADHSNKMDAGITQKQTSGKIVKIGKISAENPTVSSLLIQNSALKSNYWNIIYTERNRDKNFTRIQTGTEIYYNPETKELLWADTISNISPVAVMPETAFEFPPTMEGEKITHDFLIQNRGNAVLTVLEVKTT